MSEHTPPMLAYTVPLDPDDALLKRGARLQLPQDLTPEDAERIVGFVNSLVFDGATDE